MVLKLYKNFNTGNTVRLKGRRKKRKNGIFTIQSSSSVEIPEEFYMISQENFEHNVPYSIKKRGRWLLQEKLIDIELEEDNHKNNVVIIQEDIDLERRHKQCQVFITGSKEKRRFRTYMNGDSLQAQKLLDISRRESASSQPIESITLIKFTSPTPEFCSFGDLGVPALEKAENRNFRREKQMLWKELDDLKAEAHELSNCLTYKSKIIQLIKSSQELNLGYQVSKQKTCKTNANITKASKFTKTAAVPNLQKSCVLPPIQTDPVAMTTKTVVLERADIEPYGLWKAFGSRYIEGTSYPRRFIVDISNQLANFHHIAGCVRLLAVLVVTEVPRRTASAKTLVHCSVKLNVCLQTEGQIKLPSLLDGKRYSITELMEKAFRDAVLVDKSRLSFELCRKREIFMHVPDKNQTINRTDHETLCTRDPPAPISRIPITNATSDSCPLDSSILSCDLCQTLISTQPKLRNLTLGVYLQQCKHPFCSNCWHQHLLRKIRVDRIASANLLCPQNACAASVDLATTLSFISLTAYREYHATHDLVTEAADDTNVVYHRCANPKCTQLIQCAAKENPDNSLGAEGDGAVTFTLRGCCQKVFCAACRPASSRHFLPFLSRSHGAPGNSRVLHRGTAVTPRRSGTGVMLEMIDSQNVLSNRSGFRPFPSVRRSHDVVSRVAEQSATRRRFDDSLSDDSDILASTLQIRCNN